MTRTKDILMESGTLLAIPVGTLIYSVFYDSVELWMGIFMAIAILAIIARAVVDYHDVITSNSKELLASKLEAHFKGISIWDAHRLADQVIRKRYTADFYAEKLELVSAKFPELNKDLLFKITLDVCDGRPLDLIDHCDTTVKTIIDGRERFLTKDGWWQKTGLRDPNVSAYQKQIDEVKERYPKLSISTNNLKKISSLMYFNWELLYIAKDENEYTVQLRRRDETMNWTFTDPLPK